MEFKLLFQRNFSLQIQLKGSMLYILFVRLITFSVWKEKNVLNILPYINNEYSNLIYHYQKKMTNKYPNNTKPL